MCLLGFAMYRHLLPLRTKTVSGRNWRVFTLNSHIKEVNDFCLAIGRAPPDLCQDDLEILQSKYAQLSLALEESLLLPLLIAVDLLQPSPPIESSLHRVLIPFVHIRHRSMDLACHPGLGPLFKTVRVQGTTTAVILVTVAVHGDPLLLNDWNFHGSHIRNSRCDSHQGGHLRNTRCDSHHEGYPLQENGICTIGVTFFKANGIRIKRVTLSKANRIRFSPLHSDGIRFKGVPFSTANRSRIKRDTLSKANGIHNKRVTLSKRMGLASRGSPSPSEWDSHQEGHPLQSE